MQSLANEPMLSGHLETTPKGFLIFRLQVGSGPFAPDAKHRHIS